MKRFLGWQEFNLGATLKDDKLSGDFKAKYKIP